MALAGTLEIQMIAGMARLQSDMNQAKTIVGGAMKNIEGAVASAKTALGALGIGLGVGYFVSLIKGSIDAADHLYDLNLTTKISIENLAGLGVAAKQSGGDLDSIAASINKLAVNMGKDAEKFALLGITAKDPLEAFKQLADVFFLIQDPQMRAAVGAAALGKAWAGAAPLLSEGGKKIGDMVAAGAKASGITEEMTKRADEFKDKLDLLKASAGGATMQLASGLLPALTALIDNFKLLLGVTLSFMAAKIVPFLVAKTAALYTSVTASMAETAATLAAATAKISATSAVVFHTQARVAEAAALVAATRGMGALTLVTTALFPAQAAATKAADAHAAALMAQAVAQKAASVTSVAAGAGLGLLGGPIGWITLALGLGATAWALWGKSAENGAARAEDSIARGLAVAKRLQDQSKFGFDETGALNEALVAARQRLQTELENFEAAKAAAKSADELAMAVKSYTGPIIAAENVVNNLQGALDKTTQSTDGLSEAQKAAAAAAAGFIDAEKPAAAAAKAAKERDDFIRQAHVQNMKLRQEADEEYGKFLEARDKALADLFDKQRAHEDAAVAVLLQQQTDRREASDAVLSDFVKTQGAVRRELEFEIELTRQQEPLARSGLMLKEDEIKLASKINLERETAIALRKLDNEYLVASVQLEGDALEALGKKYDLQRQAIPLLLAEREASKLNQALVRNSIEEFRALWSTVESTGKQVWVNLFSKGVDAFEGIGKAIKASVIDLLYQLTARKWIIQIGTSVAGAFGIGTAGTALAGATGVSGATNAMGLGGWLSTGSSALSGGFSSLYKAAATSGAGQSLGLSQVGAGGYMDQGIATMTPAGSALGTGLSYAGAGLAGIAVGSAIAGNRQVVGLDGTTISAIGAVIGSAWGPIGTFVGAVAGGVIDRAFGKGPRTSGTSRVFGSFSDQGFAGEMLTPWSREGGWFSGSSSGEGYAPLAAEQQRALSSLAVGTASVFQRLIDASGEASRSLEGWTFSIDRAIQSEDDQRLLTIELAESIGAILVPEIATLKKDGENLADTAVRLSDEFALTDRLAVLLGRDVSTAFGAVGLASAAMRDQLVAAMGGVQAMTTQVQSYYENFFSSAERLVIDTQRVADELDDLGVAMPATKAEFRRLVEAQDLATAAGQRLFAGLMAIQDEFAAVADAAEQAAANIATLAELIAHAGEVATDAIEDQIRLTQDAIQASQRIADAYREVSTTILDAIRSIRGGTLSVLSPTGKYEAAGIDLDAVFRTALGGDQGALGQLPQVAQDFLAASREVNASSTAYAADYQRVLTMLDEASVASTAFAGMEEYRTTLLESQLNVLGAMKDELAGPSPDAAVLAQQLDALHAIGGLLDDQAATLIEVRSTLTDSNGNLITSLSKMDVQTGGISAVQYAIASGAGDTVKSVDLATGGIATIGSVIATGNTTADAIRDLQTHIKTNTANAADWIFESNASLGDTNTTLSIGLGTLTEVMRTYIQLQGQQALQLWDLEFQEATRTIYESTPRIGGQFDLAAFDAAMAEWRATHPRPQFATGLDYVPYDNFSASLHAGETVLNADAAEAWRSGRSMISGADLASLNAGQREVAAAIMQSSVDTTKTIREEMRSMSEELAQLRGELRRLTAPSR